jgi:hypothetical protein
MFYMWLLLLGSSSGSLVGVWSSMSSFAPVAVLR